jgi:hypothetical protein
MPPSRKILVLGEERDQARAWTPVTAWNSATSVSSSTTRTPAIAGRSAMEMLEIYF